MTNRWQTNTSHKKKAHVPSKRVVQGYFRAMFLPIFISRFVVLEGHYKSCFTCLDQNATCKTFSYFSFLVIRHFISRTSVRGTPRTTPLNITEIILVVWRKWYIKYYYHVDLLWQISVLVKTKGKVNKGVGSIRTCLFELDGEKL